MHAGILKTEKTFKEASALVLREYEIITEGQRSKRWTEGHGIRLRVHRLPFFGDLGLSEITGGKVQEYRVHRMSSRGIANPHSKSARPVSDNAPARKTLHNEIVTLRQVLRTPVSHFSGHSPERHGLLERGRVHV